MTTTTDEAKQSQELNDVVRGACSLRPSYPRPLQSLGRVQMTNETLREYLTSRPDALYALPRGASRGIAIADGAGVLASIPATWRDDAAHVHVNASDGATILQRIVDSGIPRDDGRYTWTAKHTIAGIMDAAWYLSTRGNSQGRRGMR